MSHQAKYRNDYRAPAFTIDRVELTFQLDDHATVVHNRMSLRRLGSGDLLLQGEHLQLLGVWLDGQALSAEDYDLDAKQLRIAQLPAQCELELHTQIDPAHNQALEGLYLSGEAFCTQCEAEGFRRITYYLDRPDVLAVFTTHICAPQSRFQYLLSNGNLVADHTDSDGVRRVTWHDPHPKPCYLFALVAGNFDCLEDQFVTRSGRQVRLQLFVDAGQVDRARFAMASLKHAMRWDETRFGYEYDLDIYMIVAVDFFNMGAMENKGLNIFNAKYVLADQHTATDQDFSHVESVIAHEYFHNWTGNRITCRDWFQLSLKEGLTVFRDQEFSADMGSAAVHRIDAIKIMRAQQFSEDAGPMAHPIRPDKVVEMNNFYTVTVYNKGAEVIRMQHTLLGEAGFQAGMRLYTERHDGQAVTCEDFIRAMEDANQVDWQQFRRWYSQAGTPEVTVDCSPSAEGFCLTLRQHTPATPGQCDKLPQVIPVLLSAYDKHGQRLALGHPKLRRHESGSYLLVFDSASMQLSMTCSESQPVLALFEQFSAPVKVHYQQSEADRLCLLAHAEQPVTRWEAAQSLFLDWLQQAVESGQPIQLSAAASKALQQLATADIDPALRALALTPPSSEALLEYLPGTLAVEAIDLALRSLRQALSHCLAAWAATIHDQPKAEPSSLTAAAMAQRSLYHVQLQHAVANGDDDALLRAHYQQAGNLTEQLAALQTALQFARPIARQLLDAFYQQWRHEPLVLDKWFMLQAQVPHADTVERVRALLQHQDFDLSYPNRVYALMGSFGRNLTAFHRQDGAGYGVLGQVVAALNHLNPQVAARLITPLTQWQRFDPKRQQAMQQQLQQLRQLDNLAADLEEKIEASLVS